MDFTTGHFHHVPQIPSASSMLLGLREMQQQDCLCDVTLETHCQQQKIAAHRVVLAAASPYFKAMFVNEVLETRQKKVCFKDIDQDILEAVIAYAYSAEFSLPTDRVLSLMIAADLFQMIPLQDECSAFLYQQLCPDNCLSLRAFAGMHNCHFLFDMCTKYASNNFEKVIASDEYLNLPCDQLKDLISRDEVRVTREEEVFSAVMRWVYHDVEVRKHAIPEIMSHVRLPFVSTQFLSGNVEQEVLIQNEGQCQLYIQEAYTYKQSPGKRSQLKYSPRAKPRKPSGLQDSILLVGGMCKNHPLSTVEQYELESNHWTVLSHLETARFGVAACFHNGCLYAIGGYNNSLGYLDTVECYNVKDNTWKKTAPMLQPRRYHAVHVLYGLIYAVGGQDSRGILSTTECYNSDTDQWSSVQSMNTKRMYHGLAEMDGLLFAVGGHSGPARLCSVERYDPSSDAWTNVHPMSIPRTVAGIASLGGSIYAVGGYDGKAYLNSVESYDIEVDKWFPCPSMNVCRSAMGLVGYNGHLYACGGFNGNFEVSMEKYLPSSQQWESCSDMLVEKVHFGIANT